MQHLVSNQEQLPLYKTLSYLSYRNGLHFDSAHILRSMAGSSSGPAAESFLISDIALTTSPLLIVNIFLVMFQVIFSFSSSCVFISGTDRSLEIEENFLCTRLIMCPSSQIISPLLEISIGILLFRDDYDLAKL